MRLDGTTHGWLPLALQSPGRTPGLHASSRDVARVLTEQLYGLAFSAHSARRTLRQAERLIHDAAYGSRGEYRQCCSVQLDGALLEIYSTLVSTTSAPHFAAPNRYGDPRPHDISGPTCVTSSPTWEPCIPPAVPYFASNAVAYLDRPFSLWTGLDTSWIPNARTAPRGHNYADAALWIFRALGPVGIALEVAWGGARRILESVIYFWRNAVRCSINSLAANASRVQCNRNCQRQMRCSLGLGLHVSFFGLGKVNAPNNP